MHARGQATFDSILDVTAQLLDEVGFEALTTNMVARVSGVNIATLYQYFSNKNAILRELFERQTEARTAVITDLLSEIRSGENWRSAFSTAIDATVSMRQQQPGSGPLRLAVRSSSELQEHDQRKSQVIIDMVSATLVDLAQLEPRHASVVARCSLEMLTSLLDFWSLHPGQESRELVEEAKCAILAHMALYFEPAASASSQAR